ncbi:serine/threonine-protein phosphatase 6 regulatory subunit 3-like protein isoform X2, partial [Tanacetum coccineum]
RPAVYHDQGRDSDNDYQDRDYDISALANNLSQAFRYGISENDDNIEASGSLDRDDEDAYFDNESGVWKRWKIRRDELYTEHKHDDVLNVSDSEVDEEIMVEDRNGSFDSNATKPGASTPDNEGFQ